MQQQKIEAFPEKWSVLITFWCFFKREVSLISLIAELKVSPLETWDWKVVETSSMERTF